MESNLETTAMMAIVGIAKKQVKVLRTEPVEYVEHSHRGEAYLDCHFPPLILVLMVVAPFLFFPAFPQAWPQNNRGYQFSLHIGPFLPRINLPDVTGVRDLQ